jgi:hypothetical protein
MFSPKPNTNFVLFHIQVCPYFKFHGKDLNLGGILTFYKGTDHTILLWEFMELVLDVILPVPPDCPLHGSLYFWETILIQASMSPSGQ